MFALYVCVVLYVTLRMVKSLQRLPEPLVRLLDIHVQFSRLLLAQFLARFHLVQCNEPLNNLASIFKVLVCYFVHGLYDVR